MGQMKNIATDLEEKELLVKKSACTGRDLFSYDGAYWFISPLSAAIAQRKIEEGMEFGATSGIKVYKFIKTHLSWKQRVLGWFKRD